MKRYVFHVPEQTLVTCAVVAMDEPMAYRMLEAGECEFISSRPGTTDSGKAELVMVQDIGPPGGPKQGESNGT